MSIDAHGRETRGNLHLFAYWKLLKIIQELKRIEAITDKDMLKHVKVYILKKDGNHNANNITRNEGSKQ